MPTVTLATIQELIVAGRIVEARTLLAVDGSLFNPEERDACLLEIDKRQGQAEELVARAEVMEQSGRSEEARELYVSVLERATDFPGIQEHIKRMDEALFLARAVQRRNKRIRESVSQKANKKRSWLLPAVGTGLFMALAAVAVVLTLNKPTSPPVAAPEPASPKSPVAPIVEQTTETPASPLSTNHRPPATAPSEPASLTTPPAPASDPQPNMAVVSEEPQPAEPLPPAAVPSPASTPAALPPEEALSTRPLPTRNTTPSKEDDVYTVLPGDSLSLIAERLLCHEPSWRALYHLNQDRITDPRKLQPGMQLRLTGLERRCPARP